MKICFLNPFGSPDYDPIIEEVLASTMRPDARLEIRHLEITPENMDYFAAKHLVEVGIMKAAIQAERDGFDAFVIGCCYDPGLTQCRELVDIPVAGPLEAAISLTRPFGHRWAIVTDHHKAATEIADRIRVYGQETNCRDVTSVGWFIDDMILDTASVARDARTTSVQVMQRTGAETVIIGCTIVAACYEKHAKSDPALRGISVIDPNIAAVKQAELLADLNQQGQYRIARTGYYQQLTEHDAAQARELYEILGS